MIVQLNTQLDEIQISCYALLSGQRQVRDLPVLQIGEVIIHLTFEQAAQVHEVTGEFLAGGRNVVSFRKPMKKTVQRR